MRCHPKSAALEQRSNRANSRPGYICPLKAQFAKPLIGGISEANCHFIPDRCWSFGLRTTLPRSVLDVADAPILTKCSTVNRCDRPNADAVCRSHQRQCHEM